MAKYRVEDFTMEQMQPLIEDPIGMGAKINKRLEVYEIGEDQGCKVFHLRIKLPFIISDRSIITTVYYAETSDGTQLVLNCSEGNESFVASRQSQIGKDVLGN